MRELIRECLQTKEDRREALVLLFIIPLGGAAIVAGAIAYEILMGR